MTPIARAPNAWPTAHDKPDPRRTDPAHARAAGLRCEVLRAVVAHVGRRSQIELPIALSLNDEMERIRLQVKLGALKPE
jgi:hypothetical protein